MYDRADALSRPKSPVRALVLMSALTATLGFSFAAPAEARREQSRMDKGERRVMRAINRIRVGHGLRRLKSDRALSRAAHHHTTDMLRADFFSHNSSNGASFSSRVHRFSPRPARLGENLAWVSGVGKRGVAGRIVSMWMNSPGHRAMILAPQFRRVGVARRSGAIGSLRAIVFTVDFASG